MQTLRRHSALALHGHRNGYGALSRHPLLGFSFQAWQTLWRLAGVDHMHVHGLQGKFSQTDDEVIASAATTCCSCRAAASWRTRTAPPQALPAWDAVQHGQTLAQRAAQAPELQRALQFFGKK